MSHTPLTLLMPPPGYGWLTVYRCIHQLRMTASSGRVKLGQLTGMMVNSHKKAVDINTLAVILQTTFWNAFLNENCCIVIRISPHCVHGSPVKKDPALVRIIAFRRASLYSWFELLMQIWAIQPRRVNDPLKRITIDGNTRGVDNALHYCSFYFASRQ